MFSTQQQINNTEPRLAVLEASSVQQSSPTHQSIMARITTLERPFTRKIGPLDTLFAVLPMELLTMVFQYAILHLRFDRVCDVRAFYKKPVAPYSPAFSQSSSLIDRVPDVLVVLPTKIDLKGAPKALTSYPAPMQVCSALRTDMQRFSSQNRLHLHANAFRANLRLSMVLEYDILFIDNTRAPFFSAETWQATFYFNFALDTLRFAPLKPDTSQGSIWQERKTTYMEIGRFLASIDPDDLDRIERLEIYRAVFGRDTDLFELVFKPFRRLRSLTILFNPGELPGSEVKTDIDGIWEHAVRYMQRNSEWVVPTRTYADL